MSTLKIAIEVTERDGRLRDDDPGAVVHAYDVESTASPFHDGIAVDYTVKPDIEWDEPLLRGQRCEVCVTGVAETKRA